MAKIESQTLVDTDRRLVLKLTNYAQAQTELLVVNAAALSYALQTLTTDASSNNFTVGETITANSGGTAIVQDVINSTAVMVYSVSGTFADNDEITGDTSGKVRFQNGSLAPATYRLHASKLYYVISSGCSVEVLWQGNGGGANNRMIAILTGQGTLDLDEIARANNNANVATGNVVLTTNDFDADSVYTLVLDFSKVQGYAGPYYDRNRLGF